MHLDNEKIIIIGKNSIMASTAGLLISIWTAGWCRMRNLVFSHPPDPGLFRCCSLRGGIEPKLSTSEYCSVLREMSRLPIGWTLGTGLKDLLRN